MRIPCLKRLIVPFSYNENPRKPNPHLADLNWLRTMVGVNKVQGRVIISDEKRSYGVVELLA
jgi:hypothetical protein